jgi:hypothetical protein
VEATAQGLGQRVACAQGIINTSSGLGPPGLFAARSALSRPLMHAHAHGDAGIVTAGGQHVSGEQSLVCGEHCWVRPVIGWEGRGGRGGWGQADKRMQIERRTARGSAGVGIGEGGCRAPGQHLHAPGGKGAKDFQRQAGMVRPTSKSRAAIERRSNEPLAERRVKAAAAGAAQGACPELEAKGPDQPAQDGIRKGSRKPQKIAGSCCAGYALGHSRAIGLPPVPPSSLVFSNRSAAPAMNLTPNPKGLSEWGTRPQRVHWGT